MRRNVANRVSPPGLPRQAGRGQPRRDQGRLRPPVGLANNRTNAENSLDAQGREFRGRPQRARPSSLSSLLHSRNGFRRSVFRMAVASPPASNPASTRRPSIAWASRSSTWSPTLATSRHLLGTDHLLVVSSKAQVVDPRPEFLRDRRLERAGGRDHGHVHRHGAGGAGLFASSR